MGYVLDRTTFIMPNQAGATKNIKIYKLRATDGPLSRDDVSTWVFTVKSYARQHGWTKFISGNNKTWEPTDEDDDNGMKVTNADGSVNAVETTNLVGEFHDFITTVAANCPSGFTETVIRESTSFSWIVEHIKKTFKLVTKGENFLDGLDLKFEFDENFTYSQAWMTIKDHYISSLLPSNSRYMGKVLNSKEVVSPLAMNFLVREWLMKIDPRLPEHIKNTRGHLFTEERPTLACNQTILCDQMEVLLQELETKDNTSSGNVSVGFVQSNRGRGYPGGYRGAFFPRGGRSRGRGRGPPPSFRPQTPGRRPPSCQICLEARKYDSAIGHPTHLCPFKNELRNITRQQQSAPFKVLLVPSEPQQLHTPTTASVTPAPNAALPEQVDGFYDNQYSDYYGYNDYQDQFYTDPYAPMYEQGTIEEIPGTPQNL